MKYKDWLDIWLNNYVKPTSKQKTYVRYKEIVIQHIIKGLGEHEINDITLLLLQQYTTKLLNSGNIKTGHGLSANSVNGIVNVLRNSLKVAYEVGIVPLYIAERIKRPLLKEKQVNCFTQAEQKQIEHSIFSGKKQKMLGVIICLYTGLRIGELLALEWSDIDFQKGLLFVTKACHDGKDASGKFTRITDAPKTEMSSRTIPIPDGILSIFKDLKNANLKGCSPYVIVSTKNKVLSVRAYQRSFEILLSNLKIPHRGFHALRHTFATRALECGMDVKTLSEILGHKNPMITLKRYVHSLIDHKKEMMNKVGQLLI